MRKLMIFLTLVSPLFTRAQDLARRAFLGIQMENVNDDVRRVTGYKETNGVLVRGTVPGSTAESAGFLKGDILMELGGQPVSIPNDAVEIMRGFREGQDLNYKLFRKGKILSRSVKVRGLMRENFKGIQTTYGSVRSGDNHLRTILSKPAGKKEKLPAILWIQGVGCYSMDTPMDTLRPEYQMLNSFARSGYAVMRVDKPGIGDSKGVPCNDLDFNTELDCYKAAFRSLESNPDIDAENIFIIGHSMGGVMAPLVAKDCRVKGIIGYGTIGVNFFEYFMNSRNTIAQAYNMGPAETDDFVKFHCECASMIVGSRMTKDEVKKRNTECAGMYDDYLYRAKDFWYQLYDVNIPQAWEQYKGKVLAAWGESDYISVKKEHEFIADVVNRSHKGNGTYVMVPESSHGFMFAKTFTDAQKLEGGGTYNPAAASIFLKWMNEQLLAKIDVTPAKTSEQVTRLLWNDGVENAYPRWSKDGRTILFQSNKTGKWQLYTMNTDGTGIKQVTDGNANNNFPDWNASNNQVAFVSDRDGNEEIYVMNLDGTNLKRLTNNKARDIHPYFAPDGKTLLFNSSRDNTESFEIYQVSTDGANEKRLTRTSETETCARFSPDGQKILFLKDDGNDEVYVMDADGQNVKNLTNTPQREGWPTWSADGKKIIFSSERNGNYSLFEMNADGSDVKQISFPASPQYDARACAVLNDNKILFNRQNRNTIGIFVLETNDKL